MKGKKQPQQQRLLVEGGQHRGRGWDNAQTLSWLSLDLPVSMTGGQQAHRSTGPKKGRGMGRRNKEGNKQTKSKYKQQQQSVEEN